MTTLPKVEGNFTVAGPLETFANAGGVHLARAILAEFADNVAKLVADRARDADAASEIVPRPVEEINGAGAAAPPPPQAGADRGGGGGAPSAALSRPAAAELSGGKLLWRALLSWLRQVFAGKRNE